MSEERCLEFARAIERAMNAGDLEFIDNAFDLDALYDRITEGRNPSDEDRRLFMVMVPPGFDFADRFYPDMKGEGGFRLLHFRWNDARPRGLYRLVNSDGSLHYLEFLFGDKHDTAAVVDDVYLYATGELYTTTLRRLIETDTTTPLHRVLQGNRSESTAAIDSLTMLAGGDDPQKLLAYYETLPDAVKNERAVQTLRVGAASAIGREEYNNALADMQKRLARDPGIDLVLINHYYVQENYDSVLAAVERLDKSVGGDPYLNLLRAGANIQREDYATAQGQLEQVVAADSTQRLPYYMLLNVSLRRRDYPSTARMLDLMEARLGMQFPVDSIRTDPTFADFVGTEAYRGWAARKGGE